MGAPIEFKVIVTMITLALIGVSFADCVVTAERAQRAVEWVNQQEGAR